MTLALSGVIKADGRHSRGLCELWLESEADTLENGFSAVKWKGQAHLGNPEYHLFLEACLTDGRSVDLSGSEPF